MQRENLTYWALLLIILFFCLFGCRSKKETVKQNTVVESATEKKLSLKDSAKSVEQIAQIIQSDELTDVTITEFDTEKASNPIKKTTQIKMQKKKSDSQAVAKKTVALSLFQAERKDTGSIKTHFEKTEVKKSNTTCGIIVFAIIALFLAVLIVLIRRSVLKKRGI